MATGPRSAANCLHAPNGCSTLCSSICRANRCCVRLRTVPTHSSGRPMSFARRTSAPSARTPATWCTTSWIVASTSRGRRSPRMARLRWGPWETEWMSDQETKLHFSVPFQIDYNGTKMAVNTCGAHRKAMTDYSQALVNIFFTHESPNCGREGECV